jgi:uncharacterized protein YdhG (YjbR/CyaY superfamily)
VGGRSGPLFRFPAPFQGFPGRFDSPMEAFAFPKSGFPLSNALKSLVCELCAGGNDMNPTASTVGGYLRDLPPDRRVAMARLCSMIRRSARGVRESMRYGLAFYELDGPLFALESGRRHMSLYVAEKDVVVKHKDALTGVNAAKSFIKFSDLNRLPLDVVEKIVRDSVAARRQRVSQGTVPTQAELLKLWDINEEAAAPPATTVKLPVVKPAATMTEAINAMASTMRDAMYAAIDIATGTVAPAKAPAAKKAPVGKSASKSKAKPAAKKAATKTAKKAPTAKPLAKVAKKAAPARRK